jgi:uncharacterized protein YfaS (alpha-2-macroglobulin family)
MAAVQGLSAAAAPSAGGAVDILGYELAANQDTPELCFRLSQTIVRQADTPLESFVAAEPAARLSARPRNNVLCLTGFSFGVTYGVTLKTGLPGVSGVLGKDAQFHIQIPDRPPELGFVSQTDGILPRLGGEGLPIRSVNVPAIDIAIFRISDRDMPLRARPVLTGDMVAAFAPASGEAVWRGAIEPKGGVNQDAVSFLPVDKTLGPLKPGVYVAAAWPADVPAVPGKQTLPTEYFIVSDLGLTAYRGGDGMLVSARSLSTAAALEGIDIAVVAADNRELARARTDENGVARFEGDPLRGVNGEQPKAVYAYGPSGEFDALSIDASADGAEFAEPGNVKAVIETDRARYRAGDVVGVSAWTQRASDAPAAKPPLTVNLYRPNGALFESRVLEDRGAGGYRFDFTLPPVLAEGRWRVEALTRGEPGPAGSAQFDVAGPDTDPATIALSADAAVLDPAQPGTVEIQTQYGDGLAGAIEPGEAMVSIAPAVNPFPAFPGFSFGLTDETDPAIDLGATRFTTDQTGKAAIPLKFGPLPNATRPLDARIRVRALDPGGRFIEQEIEVPIANRTLFIGVKPGGAGNFPEGQAAHFETVALTRDGARQEKPGAGWEILRRDFTPSWSWDGTRFAYRASVKDTHVAGGVVDIPADSAGMIDQNLPAGRYRIEVFDPKGEANSSAYFSVGWAPSEAGIAADPITLTPAKPFFVPGDGEDIFVKPPYDSDVTLVASDSDIGAATVQHVTAQGATLHIDTPRGARTGLRLLASAVAPSVPAAPGLPRRAIGSAELSADPGANRLDVKLDLPQKAAPGELLTVPVTVTGGGDEPVFLEIIVNDSKSEADSDDESAPSLTIEASPPSPTIFDVYGRVITPSGLSAGNASLVSAASSPVPAAASDNRDAAIASGASAISGVSASSGIVAVGKNGKADVSVATPDFTGALSVRAIAWSSSKVGRAHGELRVQNPLSAELRLPPALVQDDRAELTLALRNMDGPRGEYRIKLTADGAITLQDDADIVLNLAEHEQRFQPVTVIGRAPGPGNLTIAVSGPNGIAFERRLTTHVGSGVPAVTRNAELTLKPGATWTLEPGLTAGLRPETVSVSSTASAASDFDLPGLARELGEADYQSAERIVDQAAPRLTTGAANEPSHTDGEAAEDLAAAVGRLFDLQSADGGFTQWGSGASDPWLSAYAAEFITRARNAGAAVPDAPFARALDYLARLGALEPVPLSAAPASPAAMESAGYAAKVLAMNKRIDLSRLRYFSDRVMPIVHAPATAAFLAASFAAAGDKQAAAELFAQAQALQGGATAPDGFGSDLRDHAMLAALMAESGAVAQPSVQTAFARVVSDAAARRQFSAQEAAWIYRAQSAQTGETGGVNLKLGDKAVQQAGTVRVAGKPGEPPPPIRNLADAPLHLALTISGAPAAGESRDQSGYEAQRAFYDTTGKPIDPIALKLNDLVVVVLSGRYSGSGEGRPVIIDQLPAGWDMEAASIVDPAARYPWLKDLSGTASAELRDGAYIAAPVLSGERHEFKIAYVVRAAVRGQFAMPGTIVEDMVQPGLSTRIAGGRTKIEAPAL